MGEEEFEKLEDTVGPKVEEIVEGILAGGL